MDCKVVSKNLFYAFDYKEMIKLDDKLLIGLNVAGYLPVVGTVAGIAQVILGSLVLIISLSEGKTEMPLKSLGIISRGVVATLSLGFVMLIPDLIVTCTHDYLHKRSYTEVESRNC